MIVEDHTWISLLFLIIAVFLIVFGTVMGLMVPYFAISSSVSVEWKRNIENIGAALGGGTFIGLAMFHLLPEAAASLSFVWARTGAIVPVPFLLAFGGFILLLFTDKILLSSNVVEHLVLQDGLRPSLSHTNTLDALSYGSPNVGDYQPPDSADSDNEDRESVQRRDSALAPTDDTTATSTDPPPRVTLQFTGSFCHRSKAGGPRGSLPQAFPTPILKSQTMAPSKRTHCRAASDLLRHQTSFQTQFPQPIAQLDPQTESYERFKGCKTMGALKTGRTKMQTVLFEGLGGPEEFEAECIAECAAVDDIEDRIKGLMSGKFRVAVALQAQATQIWARQRPDSEMSFPD
eukprot:Platyproteum_vivax@DN5753_c0_g1_i1.p1